MGDAASTISIADSGPLELSGDSHSVIFAALLYLPDSLSAAL